MRKGELFPLAPGERKHLPYLRNDPETIPRAEYIGERRPPKRGEWFLSGAVVEAYRAVADLTVAYPIARIVTGRLVWVRDRRKE